MTYLYCRVGYQYIIHSDIYTFSFHIGENGIIYRSQTIPVLVTWGVWTPWKAKVIFTS